MTIGNKIFELRSAKNLSQGDLAELLEVSRQSVSKWETDGAMPELDKLIKMCDIFGVTLDELAGRSTALKPIPQETPVEKNIAFTSQRLVGYILLAVSLIGGIVALVFAEYKEDIYILIPFLLAMLACALICLFVREHAGYWCLWAILAPVSILAPNMVGLPLLIGIGIVQIIIFTALAFAANKIFSSTPEKPTKKKNIKIALIWLACMAAYIFVLLLAPLYSEIAASWFSLCFLNFAVYAAFALLVTYTVRYAKATKKK